MVRRASRPTGRLRAYRLRKRIPADIETAFGRKVITKSLGARDADEAKRKHAAPGVPGSMPLESLDGDGGFAPRLGHSHGVLSHAKRNLLEVRAGRASLVPSYEPICHAALERSRPKWRSQLSPARLYHEI
ncbi:MAG: DUF6538 domain-containing protein [Rhizobiaceae bacterium]|jgi:hypothetical protein